MTAIEWLEAASIGFLANECWRFVRRRMEERKLRNEKLIEILRIRRMR